MINVSIIGFGRAGKIQYNACKDICNVLYIVDTNTSVENFISKKELFTNDIETVLESSQVDAVIVTTPTSTHFEICRRALQHNKHVFVEKPLANNNEEYKELYELSSKKKKITIHWVQPKVRYGMVVINASIGTPASATYICGMSRPSLPTGFLLEQLWWNIQRLCRS